MKKVLLSIVVIALILSTVAFAAGKETPWDSSKVKICLAESFSDRADGKITFDDAKAGFWTEIPFYEWPAAEWKDGQIVFTDFAGIKNKPEQDTRLTFRIQTNEIQNVSAAGSVGVGFYFENNTSKVQSVGFYMVGQACCLANTSGSKIYFISTNGTKTEFTATDRDYAMVPAGQKGWVVCFYEDLDNLWSSSAYNNPEADPIRMPGFELTNLRVDGSLGESVVIDNVFFFGEGVTESHKDIVINGGSLEQPTAKPTATPTTAPTEKPTTAPTAEPTQAPVETPTQAVTELATEQATEQVTEQATEQVTEQATEAQPDDPTQQATQNATTEPAQTLAPQQSSNTSDIIIYVVSAVIIIAAVVAATLILRKK